MDDPSPTLREVDRAYERNDTEESEFDKELGAEEEADVAELTTANGPNSISTGLKVYSNL